MNYYIKKELKDDFSMIHSITEFCNKRGTMNSYMNLLRPYKKRIRERLKSMEEEKDHELIFVSEDGEDCCEKYVYDCYSIEEFEGNKIMLEACLWRTINSPYDCTGKQFTKDISFFYVPYSHKMFVYHFLGLDV
jgi:hypothetical protein